MSPRLPIPDLPPDRSVLRLVSGHKAMSRSPKRCLLLLLPIPVCNRPKIPISHGRLSENISQRGAGHCLELPRRYFRAIFAQRNVSFSLSFWSSIVFVCRETLLLVLSDSDTQPLNSSARRSAELPHRAGEGRVETPPDPATLPSPVRYSGHPGRDGHPLLAAGAPFCFCSLGIQRKIPVMN